MTDIKKITIATPMYGGQCHGAYLVSTLQFINECAINKIAVEFAYTTNESLIQRARNLLASKFLNSDSDVLLFIDGDIRFDGKAMLDMVLEGKELIGAVTPLKSFDYARIVDSVLASQSIENAHRVGGHYNFNTDMTEDKKDDVLQGKSFKVDRIGTGVLSIYRDVLEKMIPIVKSYNDDNPVANKELFYDFFPVTVEYEKGLGTNRLMSEDFNFCNNWLSLGGDIWAKDGIVHSHSGTFEFAQCLTEELKAERLVAKMRSQSQG